MSTARRQLGTGPSTTRSTPTTDPGPRLLPAERVEPGALLGDVEHQDVTADQKGRRNLGPGIDVTPDRPRSGDTPRLHLAGRTGAVTTDSEL
ncbi:hypothetical protein ADK35_08040 [Streptomyces viridochromogenes]|uniref:hypothetical protein n=1 Tax=Streptomyces viridochromogenes TaxID=1938 RepID=UPI00069DC222|nr:hypothetical protein [Streptomyces viridochromogenes]KOG25965.1 hypothetical protein ADK35_08040 [Streptomyces viridochromogenes]